MVQDVIQRGRGFPGCWVDKARDRALEAAPTGPLLKYGASFGARAIFRL
jgi:hypothetical protein